MELMSSLLFCAFATILPQALGRDVRFHKVLENYSILSKPSYTMHNKVLINTNTSPLVKKYDSLIYTVRGCSHCLYCMSRAIKENTAKWSVFANTSNQNKRHTNYNYFETRNGKENSIAPSTYYNESRLVLYKDRSYEDNILENPHPKSYFGVRLKRRSLPAITTEKIKPTKREKRKKEKNGNNFASVTKYISNGKTHALKINETKYNKNKGVETECFLYKVINTFACGSLEDDLLLLGDRKNRKPTNDKIIKHKGQKKSLTSVTQKSIFKKEINNHLEIPHMSGSILEGSFLPSVEEDY